MDSKHIETIYRMNEGDSLPIDIVELKNELEMKSEEPLTKGDWNTLLGCFLGNDRLVSRHSELIESENEGVALRAIELAYKLKGKLSEVQTEAIVIKLDFI